MILTVKLLCSKPYHIDTISNEILTIPADPRVDGNNDESNDDAGNDDDDENDDGDKM